MNTLQRLQRGTTEQVDQDNGAVSWLVWVVGTCAVVLTSWILGASWLGSALFGLPAGLWIMGLVLGGRWAVSRAMAQRSVAESFSSPATTELSRPRNAKTSEPDAIQEPSDGIPLDATLPVDTPSTPLVTKTPSPVSIPSRMVAGAAEGVLTIVRSGSGGTLPGWLERWSEASGTPGACLSRPLHVAVRLDHARIQALGQVPSSHDIEFTIWSGPSDRDLLRRHGFDALIEHGEAGSGVLIHVAEAPESPAAWHDWSLALPLSYASLFPSRLDAALVTITEFDWDDDRGVAVLRSLLEACALFGRYPSRVGIGDRLRGRPALALMLGSPVVSDPAIDRVMRHMAGVLGERMPHQAGEAERAAMRVLGAYLAWNGCGLLPDERSAAARAIGRLGAGEGETYLRACVAAFAGGQEVLAYDLLLTGHERLSIERPEPLVDPMEYLVSDIAFNRSDAESLGRLAAGLGYSTALIAPSSLPYILDDVRDEVMSARWLTVDPDTRDQVLATIEALATARIRSAA